MFFVFLFIPVRPWSADKCVRGKAQRQQYFSACNSATHFGLNKHQGRGMVTVFSPAVFFFRVIFAVFATIVVIIISPRNKKIVSCFPFSNHSYQYYSISCQHCLSHPGAPEIDILEAMPGFENLHKNNPNTYTHLPYYSASLQVSPGMLDCRFLECLHYGIAVCEVNNA